jgi:prevent-host-death family protein
MLYNSRVVDRLALSKFRYAIREVVRKAEDGEPTILTHYRRPVAAIVPMEMFSPPEKKGSASEAAAKSKNRAS